MENKNRRVMIPENSSPTTVSSPASTHRAGRSSASTPSSNSLVSSLLRTMSTSVTDQTLISQDLEANDANACYACTGVDTAMDQHEEKVNLSSTCLRSGKRLKENMKGTDWGKTRWWFGTVLDPRSSFMQMWTKVFLSSCILSIAVDPCFLYILFVQPQLMCVQMARPYVLAVTVLRSTTDLMYLAHLYLQLRTAYIANGSLAIGQGGELVSDARKIARRYSRGGLLIDTFVTLPVPQLLAWIAVPAFLRRGDTSEATLIVLLGLLQYLPKVWRILGTFQNTRRVNGFVFGSPWGGFALNLAAYVICAHMFGAVWYAFATWRVTVCLQTHCQRVGPTECSPSWVSCPSPFYSGENPTNLAMLPTQRIHWAGNATLAPWCADVADGGFSYGIYESAVRVVVGEEAVEKLGYGLFFGLMTLSSFGNALVPSSNFQETAFSIIMIMSGLILFVLLIGNIQVFLQSITSREASVQSRIRDLEWWMGRRRIPQRLRQRVRRHERANYVATRGVQEDDMLSQLPESLRRDVKRHLCLPLVKKVPLFAPLDAVVLDNICDRLKPALFIENTVIVQEGEPVTQLIFIVRGKLQSKHVICTGRISNCILSENNFCGEELLTWCLGNESHKKRLPLCAATVTTISTVEAFALAAEDLAYVMDHFGDNLGSRKMQSLIQYYSPNWRTWAAVNIQLAWRRYKSRKHIQSSREQSLEIARSPVRSSHMFGEEPCNRSDRDRERMRLCAAILTAHKPER